MVRERSLGMRPELSVQQRALAQEERRGAMSRGLLPAVCVLLAGTRTPAQERRYSLSVDHGGGIDAVRDFRLRRSKKRFSRLIYNET